MLVPSIEIKAKGFIVRSTARDFPCLDDLAWLDLKPFGVAPAVPARLDSIPLLGGVA